MLLKLKGMTNAEMETTLSVLDRNQICEILDRKIRLNQEDNLYKMELVIKEGAIEGVPLTEEAVNAEPKISFSIRQNAGGEKLYTIKCRGDTTKEIENVFTQLEELAYEKGAKRLE